MTRRAAACCSVTWTRACSAAGRPSADQPARSRMTGVGAVKRPEPGSGDLAATDGIPGPRSGRIPGISHQPAPPDVIYIIRHGEKPEEPAPGRSAPAHRGVDFHGNQNEHSLLPRGWQRSGALAVLFDPRHGPLRAGLQVPRMLISPSYGHGN